MTLVIIIVQPPYSIRIHVVQRIACFWKLKVVGSFLGFCKDIRYVSDVAADIQAQATSESMSQDEKVVQELEKSRGESRHVAIDDAALAGVTGPETCVNVGSKSSFESKNIVSRYPISNELSLSIEQKPNVRLADDKHACSITDCCIMDNGTMLLTDDNNNCIKLFDKAYQVLDRFVLQGIPEAVCVIGTDEVAVTCKKAVQFAKVDAKIRLTRSFSVGETCRGISFSNNRLLISCGGWSEGGEGPGQMRIYDTSGALLQTIKHDSLTVPFHNMMTRDGRCIVANRFRGVLAFTNTGKLKWQYKHADLKFATGLCEVDEWVLVCCIRDGHVFQVNPVDQSSHILLRGSDELKQPRSLTYDKCNDKLIVTKSLYCDHMLVYNIRRK